MVTLCTGTESEASVRLRALLWPVWLRAVKTHAHILGYVGTVGICLSLLPPPPTFACDSRKPHALLAHTVCYGTYRLSLLPPPPTHTGACVA